MISVVICTYNRAAYLEQTLATFFRQEHLDRVPHELIVVDNNSSDNTPEVVQAFSSHRALHYHFESKQGLSRARNRGVTESRGEIIAYLDDDVLTGHQRQREQQRREELAGDVAPHPDWGVKPDLVVKMTPDQVEKSVELRQDADIIENWKDEKDREPRPEVTGLLADNLDPQLETALLILQARALKDHDAAAALAAR